MSRVSYPPAQAPRSVVVKVALTTSEKAELQERAALMGRSVAERVRIHLPIGKNAKRESA